MVRLAEVGLPLPTWGEGGGEGVTGAPSRDVTPSPHPSPSGRGSRARRARRWCLCFHDPYRTALVVLAFLILPALALDFPALTGRVVDEANVLDPATQAALTQKLADLEAKTTDQLVVVTLKSLQGTSIDDFGVQLGRRWQIGQKGKNNGVLLIVAPNERQVRIEVGYGLEGTLTDAVSRLIIENGIVPRFRANDVPGGISRGVDDIISVLTGDADEWKQRAARRPDTVSPAPSTQSDSVWPGILLVLGGVGIIIVCFLWLGVLCQAILRILLILASSGGGGRSGSSGGFSGGGGSFGGGGASGRW